MDNDSSPDEKEFPGLFEAAAKFSKKEIESSESEEKTKKIDKLLKKSDKDKKDKKEKETKYEALGGDESDEESKLFRSPSKSSKKKTFKFPSTRKEKSREKSREKEEPKEVKDVVDGKDKKKESKIKSKDKKEKKSKSGSLTSADDFDLIPIFGVSLGLAVERSRCHDNVNIPQVVRHCIDFLQENLQNEQIYKTEGVKTKLQQLKKSYNNREANGDDLDVPTACSLLKMFLKELPEPVLTTELTTRFEEVGALPEVAQQAEELYELIDQLPSCNQVLLAWVVLHFSAVAENEKYNKLNAQSLAVLLSPVLQMSHRLMITILCHAETLFADTELNKYIPPMTATSPDLPETSADITKELRKQESLLSQIHSEMNAGFVTKKREEELWETQRIITQLKRKLRSFEKKQDSMQKSMDVDAIEEAIDFTLQTTKPNSDDESLKTITGLSTESNTDTKTQTTPQETLNEDVTVILDEKLKFTPDVITVVDNHDRVFVGENGFLMLANDHPEHDNLIRLQIENQELANWKQQLQSRINAERSEVVRLKRMLSSNDTVQEPIISSQEDPDSDRLIEHYMKENALLEQKRMMLAKELYSENIALIQMEVDLRMKQISH